MRDFLHNGVEFEGAGRERAIRSFKNSICCKDKHSNLVVRVLEADGLEKN